MEYFTKVWNGEIGTVVEESDWDEEQEVLVIDNRIFEFGNVIDQNVDEFLEENGVDNLVLFRDDGYRGVGCYSGYMKIGDKHYSLDIINDYVVYEIEDTGIVPAWRS